MSSPPRLGSKLSLGSRDLEQIKAIESHANRCSPFIKACWSHVCRMKRTLKRPIFYGEEGGHWAVFRHGAEKLMTPLVPEQVVSAIACI